MVKPSLRLEFFEADQVGIAGYAAELRAAARALREPTGGVVPLTPRGGILAELRVRRTPGALLRVAVEGDALVVECDPGRIDPMFIDLLDDVADEAEDASGRGVARHVHIEYLGEGDDWRAPDSVPLVIGEHRTPSA